MQDLLRDLIGKACRLFRRTEAQNLTEYALAVAVIGFATVAGMSQVASSVNHTFIAVTNVITTGTQIQ